MAGNKDKAALSRQQSAVRKTKKANRKKQTRKTKPLDKKPFSGGTLLTSPIEFPEVKGKTVTEIRLYLHDEDTAISMHFADKTYLNFSLEPRITVRPSLSDFTTGDLKEIKTWAPTLTESSYIDD